VIGPQRLLSRAGTLLPEPLWFRIQALRLRVRHASMRTDPAGRSARRALAELRDSHRGQRCVILGNGPSLNGFDVARLGGAATFCTNRGYLLWEGSGRSPNFYVAVNPLMVEQFADEIAAQACPVFVPWILRKHLADAPNAIFTELRIEQRFLTDALQGLAPCGTVTIAALQLAYHLGFSEAVLIGVDHRYETAGSPHSEVLQSGEDPNHFRADYFGEGTVWNAPDLAQSERGYRMAAATFAANGRRIINATPGSALEVFERGELEDLLDPAPVPGRS
jgi:hypothetical protein